ncbi:sulfatase-like hydrolase/transferase [Gaetbulibacter saemankumensis]|uniref:sulfatase-like hydrolase/transferase n=1 Tax=Gaetbulibacter saemankumensis TaxID=311208 RepID=UPI001B7F7EC7|nr:sulfatase-like hydrolase/transferase [Gaetbulibacter saemankumensis]
MKFTSFHFLLVIGFLKITYMEAQEQSYKNETKPNFILIVADDLGFADLSLNGSTQIKTPNIDLLAKKGVNFTEAYVSSAVCSPSRAGLLTGINQVEFGHDNNIGGSQKGFDPDYLGLPIEQKTVANYLKDLGYTTGLIGKWHLGDEPQFHPLKRGFDEFWGYTGGGHDYFASSPNGKGYDVPIECNYKMPEPITYITDDKGDECVDFINRHQSTPFFLFASFNAPHAPLQATQDDLNLYKHIKDIKRRTYAAMVHRLDVNIGKIVDALDQNNLSKNTVVVFISDNGGPVDANASLNAPYRGQKGILLEGGIHVPYIIKWPSKISAGTVYKKPISSLDITPTFVALAGGHEENTKFTGKNLIPYITKEKQERPHEALMWRFTISSAIRMGGWKLISIPDRLPMLYYLPDDVTEQNDLALKHIEKTQFLLKKLGDWNVSLPHPLFLEGSEWKRNQLNLYDREYKLVQPKRND